LTRTTAFHRLLGLKGRSVSDARVPFGFAPALAGKAGIFHSGSFRF
jgi:hypothetical protein